MTGSQLALNMRLRADATLEKFMGDTPGRLDNQDPVNYLWGLPGSGKSHLLQGSCHRFNHNGLRSIYLDNLGTHKPEMLKGLAALDLVCLDDIELVIGDRRWELAVFDLLNSVRDSKRARLMMSAAVPAARLDCVLPDLGSRLRAAYSIETARIGDDSRLDILKNRASEQGFHLSDEVGRYILGRAPRDMHHLVKLLATIEKETIRLQKKVTIPFVKKVLNL